MFRSCCMGVLYVIALGILSLSVYSQNSIPIQFFIDQRKTSNIFPKIRDTVELSYQLHQWVLSQQMEGFLLAGLDSVKYLQDEVSVYLNKGSKYRWIFKDSSEYNVTKDNYSTKLKALRTDSNDFLSIEYNNWVLNQANRGYPFASAHLTPIGFSKDTILIQLNLEKGEEFRFGSVNQGEKPFFKNYVFHKISGIRPGELFSHAVVQRSGQRISRLANMLQEAEPLVIFPGNKCVIRYYLKQNKSSKFDFLLGLNPFDGPNGREYRLTGLGNLQLYNLFKLSEDILLKYENLNNNAPKFLMNLKFPYLPYLPVGIQYDLSLYRYRETYFEFKHKAVVEFPMDMNSRIGISLIGQSSDLLNPDTSFLITQKRLPPVLDFNYFSVGVRMSHLSLNHLWIPTHGVKLNAELHYGKKSYGIHPVFLEYETDQLKVQEQFDSLNLNNRQAIFGVQFENYRALGKRSVFKLALKSEGFLGKTEIVDNERFRLGGSQNLRGFDEDFYLASAYVITSLEYRYLLDRQSYLSLFHDLGFLQQRDQEQEIWNVFNGSGLGIHFTTPIGLFSVQFAVGAGAGQSFDFGKGKIHFGYSALF